MKPKYKNAIDFSDNGIGSIGSIYITGGGFVNREFKGVSPNSAFGWNELVWKKTPTRSNNFSFDNIDDIDVVRRVLHPRSRNATHVEIHVFLLSKHSFEGRRTRLSRNFIGNGVFPEFRPNRGDIFCVCVFYQRLPVKHRDHFSHP